MAKFVAGTRFFTSLRCGILALAIAVMLPAAARAQALGGSLVGTVLDETGAALPGASVIVTQMETNLSRDLVTNENGAYSATNLLPGTYTGGRHAAGVPDFHHQGHRRAAGPGPSR